MWGISALFYLAVFFLRAAPAVMTSELMRDFGIGASLGNLSAFYFYFYVAMQIPVGALTNSWGPRKLLVIGAISAALGQFLFGATSNFALACVGRAIIGGSTAVGSYYSGSPRTGSPATSSPWCQSSPFRNLGALFAQVPLRLGVEYSAGRSAVSSALILAIGSLAWFVVRDDPERKGPARRLRSRSTTKSTSAICGPACLAVPNTWLILIAQEA